MSKTIHQALCSAKQSLQMIFPLAETSQEAEILLAFSLKKSRSYLLAFPEKEVTSQEQKFYDHLIKRRLRKEPIAYILGQKEFWSLQLTVNQDTLIPRPETELLVEQTLHQLNKNEATVADLGTGSGAIALALAKERPKWQIIATDISKAALTIAKKNAQDLEVTQVQFCQGNWCQALPLIAFDAIISNPPYIAELEWEVYSAQLAYEPYSALVSGLDGLNAIRKISQTAHSYLKPSGFLLFEHGFNQANAVREILTMNLFERVYSILDLAGHERVTIGFKAS